MHPAERAHGVEFGLGEDVRHAAIVVAHVDRSTQSLEHERLLARQFGHARRGPHAVCGTEQLSERGHRTCGHEPHVERTGERCRRDAPGDRARHLGPHS